MFSGRYLLQDGISLGPKHILNQVKTFAELPLGIFGCLEHPLDLFHLCFIDLDRGLAASLEECLLLFDGQHNFTMLSLGQHNFSILDEIVALLPEHAGGGGSADRDAPGFSAVLLLDCDLAAELDLPLVQHHEGRPVLEEGLACAEPLLGEAVGHCPHVVHAQTAEHLSKDLQLGPPQQVID
jgi:hypothetical protein